MPATERFYYFTPTKYALEGVKNRRLKVAELEKANDPFEFLPVRCNKETEEAIFRALKQSISDDMKMICLSKTYKNPSLWGHYADNCKGICLGFDIEIHEDKEKNHISKIIYVEDKLDMSAFGFNYVDDVLKYTEEKIHNVRHYKSHHWKHEEEWRIWEAEKNLKLDPITGLYFFPLGSLLELREVLIGFRCEDENIRRRFEIAIEGYSEPPEIIFTRLSSSAFEIEVDKDRQK